MSKTLSPPHTPEGPELRFAAGSLSIDYRADDPAAPDAFVGKAIVCDVRSKNLGGFVEIITREALNDTDLTDVKGLFNHDRNYLLGTTGAKTLELTRDTDGGLSYRIPYDALDPDHVRVMRKVQRGDVVGSSFAFNVPAGGADWDVEESEAGTLYVRTVKKINRLFDVSPVTDPAYADTSAAKRSLEAYQQAHAPTVPLSTRQAAVRALALSQAH